MRHLDEIFQDAFGDETDGNAQDPQCKQVGIGLPLPCTQCKRLEHGQRQHREADADDAHLDGLFLLVIHFTDKSKTNHAHDQPNKPDFAFLSQVRPLRVFIFCLVHIADLDRLISGWSVAVAGIFENGRSENSLNQKNVLSLQRDSMSLGCYLDETRG